MSDAVRGWARNAVVLALVVASVWSSGCGSSTPPPSDTGMPIDPADGPAGVVWGPPDSLQVTEPRPIETVLAEHTPRLMAIPGVVGTYQTEDSQGRGVIGVLVSAVTPELRKAIPTKIENYPVRFEVTDEIRPLPDSL